MRGYVHAALYFCVVLAVVAVGAPKHLLVGEGGPPVKVLLYLGRIEDEILRYHLVVVRS